MAKEKISFKQKQDISGSLLIIALIIMTIGLMIYTTIAIIRPWDIKSFSEIKSTSETNVLNEEGNSKNEYYVYIYQKDSYKLELLENELINYANYAKKTEDARPLYVLDFNYRFSTNVKDILNYKETDLDLNLPTLILVQNNKVASTKYKTVSEIKTEIYNSLQK